MKKRIVLGLILAILCGTALLLVWGRLAPLSPWIVGFEHRESSKAMVYYHQGTSLLKLAMIDSLIEQVESWHRLTFKTKPRILLCGSDREYRRIAGRRARFVVFPPHGRLYVSASALRDANEGRIHFDVYLAHELSHALLYQNMSSWRALSYPGWLLEGIAVRSSDQMGVDGYLTKEAATDTIRKGYFVPPDDWGTIVTKQKKSITDLPLENKMWFIYAEFGCLVDRLIGTYGKDPFLRFLNATLTESDYQKSFKNAFGVGFEEFLRLFRDGLAPSWP
jgi:hypothetical protein